MFSLAITVFHCHWPYGVEYLVTGVFFLQENNHMMVAYSAPAVVIYDVETGQPVIRLDTTNDPVSGQVRQCCSSIMKCSGY